MGADDGVVRAQMTPIGLAAFAGASHDRFARRCRRVSTRKSVLFPALVLAALVGGCKDFPGADDARC